MICLHHRRWIVKQTKKKKHKIFIEHKFFIHQKNQYQTKAISYDKANLKSVREKGLYNLAHLNSYEKPQHDKRTSKVAAIHVPPYLKKKHRRYNSLLEILQHGRNHKRNKINSAPERDYESEDLFKSQRKWKPKDEDFGFIEKYPFHMNALPNEYKENVHKPLKNKHHHHHHQQHNYAKASNNRRIFLPKPVFAIFNKKEKD